MGLAHHWAHLRSLANLAWTSNLKLYVNCHFARTSSDHALMFLNAQANVDFKSRIFHFDNIWLDYEGCHSYVVNA